MASYDFSYTATSIIFFVNGISAGDQIRFIVLLTSNTNDRTIADVQTSAGATMTMWYNDRLTPGTSYTCNCRIEGQDWMGSRTFTTPAATPSVTRPSNWSWWSTISSGSTVAITASEWNSFCSRINEFREYKGLTEYYFTSAYKGNPITAAMANQLVYAIDAIPGHGTLPGVVSSGSKMYASFFITLRNALNAIT